MHLAEMVAFEMESKMNLSQTLQPPSPSLSEGPVQPSTQLLLHSRQTPLSLYLCLGHSLTQYGPSMVFLHSVQFMALNPLQPPLHS